MYIYSIDLCMLILIVMEFYFSCSFWWLLLKIKKIVWINVIHRGKDLYTQYKEIVILKSGSHKTVAPKGRSRYQPKKYSGFPSFFRETLSWSLLINLLKCYQHMRIHLLKCYQHIKVHKVDYLDVCKEIENGHLYWKKTWWNFSQQTLRSC